MEGVTVVDEMPMAEGARGEWGALEQRQGEEGQPGGNHNHNHNHNQRQQQSQKATPLRAAPVVALLPSQRQRQRAATMAAVAGFVANQGKRRSG